MSMDKILRIDMGAEGGPKATIQPLGDYAGLGGRAMTSLVVSAEVDPLCHPLSAANKLVFAPGMLTGSAASTSGRISVGCKSPLTGGIKEANAGGQAGQAIARLGYAAIVVEGQPAGDDLWTILINTKGVSFKVDNDLRGLGTYDSVEKLRAEYGEKVTFMLIGQAGEMMLPAASIAACDRELHPTRHMGRGGVGAVMGSKKIKAFILDETGTRTRQPADAARFKAAATTFNEGLRSHGVTGTGLPSFGTNVLTNILNEAGGYPTRNFSTGQFEDATKISGETQAAMMTERGGEATHGCHRGCIIQCSGIYNDATGKYLSKQAEYETVWSHGGNCGISDLDIIQTLDRMDDDFGLDTIDDRRCDRRRHGGWAPAVRRRRGSHPRPGRGRQGHPARPDHRLGRRRHRQGLRRRARAGRQEPGAAGLRPAGRPGHGRHLRHDPDGRRPHGRLRRSRRTSSRWAASSTPSSPKARSSCRATCRSRPQRSTPPACASSSPSRSSTSPRPSTRWSSS